MTPRAALCHVPWSVNQVRQPPNQAADLLDTGPVTSLAVLVRMKVDACGSLRLAEEDFRQVTGVRTNRQSLSEWRDGVAIPHVDKRDALRRWLKISRLELDELIDDANIEKLTNIEHRVETHVRRMDGLEARLDAVQRDQSELLRVMGEILRRLRDN